MTRTGRPIGSGVSDPVQRFWTKVDKNGPMPNFSDPLVRVGEADGNCWVWTDSCVNKYPSGFYFSRDLRTYPHRIVFLIENGELPPADMTVDHLCRNTKCVRLNHLEIVTVAENLARAAGVCDRGHEISGDNVKPNGSGSRRCRKCYNDWARRRYWKAAKKELQELDKSASMNTEKEEG